MRQERANRASAIHGEATGFSLTLSGGVYAGMALHR